MTFASYWTGFLGALAILLLISGVDDFVPILICCWTGMTRRLHPCALANSEATADRPSRIAIFVPCWREADVIGNMIRHNAAAIRYRNFDFILGVYPNDQPTLTAAEELTKTFRNVRVAVCGHAGPTSKADCLNSIYARMEAIERESGIRFDTVVLHDAEDIIHPDALNMINRARREYAMVQVPVLALPTGLGELTHGVYCDEFAEFQTIDMRARQSSGSFVPSNGVGTAFAREVLVRLAKERSSEVFDPGSLTEDYEIGVYIHAAGYRQMFAPLSRDEKGWVATREYFPRKLRAAIRQRTRWVTGIGLQCWERVGWRGDWRVKYWFWRDRKGLLANPLSLLANLAFLAGSAGWTASAAAHVPWMFAVTNPTVAKLCWITLLLQLFRLMVRAACVSRIYGALFAAGVPFRAFLANLINCCASLGALWQYFYGRRAGRRLAWQKTEHVYPGRTALALEKRDLLDVLLELEFLSRDQAAALRGGMPAGVDAGDYLLQTGLISEDILCLAISLQCGVPAARLDLERVRKHVVRSLPTHVERRFGLVPCDLQAGRLMLVGRRVPEAEAFEELKTLTSLKLEFHIVPNRDYEALRRLL